MCCMPVVVAVVVWFIRVGLPAFHDAVDVCHDEVGVVVELWILASYLRSKAVMMFAGRRLVFAHLR